MSAVSVGCKPVLFAGLQFDKQQLNKELNTKSKTRIKTQRVNI